MILTPSIVTKRLTVRNFYLRLCILLCCCIRSQPTTIRTFSPLIMSAMDCDDTGCATTTTVPSSSAAALASSTSAKPAAEPLVHIYTQNIGALLPPNVRPSSGGLPTADRVCAPTSSHVFLSCQNHVSLLLPSYPVSPVIKQGRQGAYASDFIPLQGDSRLETLVKHRTEVQQVRARQLTAEEEYLVASVDSYGTAQVQRIRINNGTDAENGAAASSSSSSSSSVYTLSSSYSLLPPAHVADGWHGVALHPSDSREAVVASYHGRSLSVYHEDRLMQVLYTHAAPTSLSYLTTPHSSQPLLCCTEGNTLSIWDLRMSNSLGQTDNISRGAIQRLQETSGDLFAISTHSESGLVATGGVDKQVTVYDTKKFSVAGRWKNVLKYEIMALDFSAYSSSHIYVTGLDHEIYCGSWTNNSSNQRNLERSAFRGDSRWFGVTRVGSGDSGMNGKKEDTIIGVTMSAQCYVLKNAHLQNGPVEAEDANAVSSKAASSSSSSASSSHNTNAKVAAAKQRRDKFVAQRKERIAAGLPAETEEEKAKLEQKKERKQAGKKRKNEETVAEAKA